MKTKYNYDLEVKQLLIIYLKLLALTIYLPFVAIFLPFFTFLDFCMMTIEEKFEKSYGEELYRRYLWLTNIRIDL